MFQRIAIVNRGEAAMRLIHAVRDLNAQAGPGGTASRRSRCTPTASGGDVRPRGRRSPTTSGPASARPYLDHAVLERALRRDRGRRRVGRLGLRRRGPGLRRAVRARSGSPSSGRAPEAMRKLGDKIGSKLIAEEVGVPVAPWSRGAVDTLDDAIAAAAADRLPADAQGDRGRRRARHPRWSPSDAELADAYERTRDEAAARVRQRRRLPRDAWSPAPGTSRCRSSPTARARPGRSACATARCSAATRRSSRSRPRRCSTPAQAAELKASAERLALAVGYARRRHRRVPLPPAASSFFAFLEVNTRLQVEHPITEVDHRHRPGQGCRSTWRPAAGSRGTGRPRSGTPSRPGSTPRTPTATSRRRPGRIVRLELPAGPGIRVDTGVGEGDSIPADFDSMIAKIIAYGPRPRRGARPAAPGDGARPRSSSRAARPTRASCSTCSTSRR